MTSREIGLCNGIIHSASVAAAAIGGGLAQVPTSDNLLITPIQLTMAISLGKVFGIDLDQSAAKALPDTVSASHFLHSAGHGAGISRGGASDGG